MIRKYLIDSLKLTKSNIGPFVQATILLVVTSILTGLLLFPVLVTGLEGMYLKARSGETVKSSDVFMYVRKSFPLLGATIVIALLIFVVPLLTLLGFIGLLSFMISSQLRILGFLSPLLAILFVPGFFVFTLWIEGKHLHALNLVAERNVRVFDALRQSRGITKHPWASAFLAFLYWIVLMFLLDASFTAVNQTPIIRPVLSILLGLIVFPIVVGATAMAYAYEIDVSEESGTAGTNASHPRP